MARPACDPVGLRDIADRLGVPRPTVKGWNLRRLMPSPRWTASGVPLWNWPDVERWLEREAPALGVRIARKGGA
ncbi:MAG: DNA-binding protein [Chloroflexi bacterium]|nr:DNA-binding protein [Chloroflexota bacterium]